VLFSSFTQTKGKIELLILGSNFKKGAHVFVGKQKATSVSLTRRGSLEAVISASGLGIGSYDLRVANPNGLEAVRHRKISIVSGQASGTSNKVYGPVQP
jgi:hypothetical protein